MAKGRFYIFTMAPIGAIWQENENFPAEKGWELVPRKDKGGCEDPTGAVSSILIRTWMQARLLTYKYLLIRLDAQLLQSCPTLCNPMDCGLPGSSVLRILQAGIVKWVTCPPPRHLPDPGIKSTSPASSALPGGFFTHWVTREAHL